jgi:hypothetical protein
MSNFAAERDVGRPGTLALATLPCILTSHASLASDLAGMVLFRFLQLWNAAANDEIRLSPPQPRHMAMGLRNSGWLWNYGSHEVAGAVDTVEGRTHKASFD